MVDTSEVIRLEIVDHTKCTHCHGGGRIHSSKDPNYYIECAACGGSGVPGRSVVFWDKSKQIGLELQDYGRTLKIFIHERLEDGNL